jgi:hypothetical protein
MLREKRMRKGPTKRLCSFDSGSILLLERLQLGYNIASISNELD